VDLSMKLRMVASLNCYPSPRPTPAELRELVECSIDRAWEYTRRRLSVFAIQSSRR